MNLIQYIKKIINNCFIKKNKDKEYIEVILFTPEEFDSDEMVELDN